MPNWCGNNLAVYGTPEDLREFTDKLNEKEFFASFLPTPKELVGRTSPERDEEYAAQMRDKHGAVDWYDWQVRNWGTKWDVDLNTAEAEAPEGLAVAAFTFDSAWTPPQAGISSVSELYPKLTFFLSWDEPGNDFAGYQWYRAGVEAQGNTFESPSNAMRAIEFPDGYEAADELEQAEDLRADEQDD